MLHYFIIDPVTIYLFLFFLVLITTVELRTPLQLFHAVNKIKIFYFFFFFFLITTVELKRPLLLLHASFITDPLTFIIYTVERRTPLVLYFSVIRKPNLSQSLPLLSVRRTVRGWSSSGGCERPRGCRRGTWTAPWCSLCDCTGRGKTWTHPRPQALIYLKRKEVRKCCINDTLNTFYLRLYGVRHMVKDHSDSVRGN